MATEALRQTARAMGHTLRVETQTDGDPRAPLAPEEIANADAVVLVGDADRTRFGDTPVHAVPVSRAITHTRAVLEAALALAAPADGLPAEVAAVLPPVSAPEPPGGGRRLVAITACPTGIAHTFMAAEALQKAAAAMGHSIHIETQGSVGVKTPLTPEEIDQADAVVIAAETAVDTSRFAGKRLYETSTKHALRAGTEVIESALDAPVAAPASSGAAGGTPAARVGPYRHLMTGVSYMLPVVIAGGLAIALAFALGGIYAGDQEGTLAWALSLIGGETAFGLFVAVLSGYIAFSIADRPGLAPGLVGGMLAQTLGAGFLGGIASGFLAGYLTRFLAEKIRMPAGLDGLKPVLVLPLLSTLTVGLLMIFVVAPPVEALNQALNGWLLGLQGANAAVLGALLGGMMAVDMGGPINKAAYAFSIGLLGSEIYGPMAAVMAGGMTPPLGLAIAALLFRSRFDAEEREAGAPAGVLGLAFITEGAIPFAAKDPFRVIPALVAGAAVAGGVSMALGVQLLVPHGGLFVVAIPGAVRGLVAYLGALALGTAVTVGTLYALKRPLAPAEVALGTELLADADTP